jgi:hypothetical protein
MAEIAYRHEGALGTIGVPVRPARGMQIHDGRGGTLTLDPTALDLRCLADAARFLLAGPLPLGASVLKVTTGAEVYLLSRRAAGEDTSEELVSITRMYDRTEDVLLSRDLVELVLELLERLGGPALAKTAPGCD